MEKITYDFVIYHIDKLINVESIKEIRHIKVLRKSQVNKEISILKLLFLTNDFVGFKENGIRDDVLNYFIIKTDYQFFLCGFEITFSDNGLKSEKMILFQKINKLLSYMLSSKYNRMIYP